MNKKTIALLITTLFMFALFIVPRSRVLANENEERLTYNYNAAAWEEIEGYRYYKNSKTSREWTTAFGDNNNRYSYIMSMPETMLTDTIEMYNTNYDTFHKIENDFRALKVEYVNTGTLYNFKGYIDITKIDWYGNETYLDTFDFSHETLVDKDNEDRFRVRYHRDVPEFFFDGLELTDMLIDYWYVDWGRMDSVKEYRYDYGYEFSPTKYLVDINKTYYINSPENYHILHEKTSYPDHEMFTTNEVVVINYLDGKWQYDFGNGIYKHDLNKVRFIKDSHYTITLKNETGNPKRWYMISSSNQNIYDNFVLYSNDDQLPGGNHSVWYYDSEFNDKVQDGDLLTRDVTIYRRTEFYDPYFTLTFDVDGGENIDPYVVNKEDYGIGPIGKFYLKDIGLETLPIPKKEGYVFVKWKMVDYNHNFPAENIQFNGNEATFIAIWEAEENDVTVTFHNNPIYSGSTNNRYTIEVKIPVGTRITSDLIPDVQTNPLFRFTGWVTGSSTQDNPIYVDFEKEIKEDVTYYSSIEKVEYFNIKFDVDGGVSMDDMQIRISSFVSTGQKFKSILPVAVKARWAFAGWYVDREFTEEVPTELFGSREEHVKFYDITIYAKFVYDSVRVNFITNQNSLEVSSHIFDKGHILGTSALPPKVLGFDFVGWFYDEDLTVEYLSEELHDDEVTFYAKWERNNDEIPEEVEPIKFDFEVIFYALIAVGVIMLIFVGSTKKNKKRRRR